MMRQDLENFSAADFERGRPAVVEFLWHLAHALVFRPSALRAYGLKRALLRCFGGKIGEGVVVKPGARLSFPWRTQIGEHAWIGEDAQILSLDDVKIGAHTCISQRAFLCTGNHDWAKPSFDLRTAPITLGRGVWICANVFIGPGVSIGDGCVVTAGSVVTSDLPEGMICSGNPCRPVRPRPTARA